MTDNNKTDYSCSVVICTRNRADQLKVCLEKLPTETFVKYNIQLVLVDSDSSDNTFAIIEEFKKKMSFPIDTVKATEKGLGRALNRGLELCKSDIIVSTDDDCYFKDDYFKNLFDTFDVSKFQYAGGAILLYKSDHARVGVLNINKEVIIPPKTFLPAGTIQGANMIIHRSVIDKIGGFRDDMGAGTQFPCEDIEFMARASLAGFTGAQLPNLVIYHDHGREKGSKEHLDILERDDIGRGAYYSSLLINGNAWIWDIWLKVNARHFKHKSKKDVWKKMAMELKGASDYILHRIDSDKID